MEMYDSLQTWRLLRESDFVRFHESLPPILYIFVLFLKKNNSKTSHVLHADMVYDCV